MSTLRCRAPSVAMEFGPTGEVQACCANVLYPLGNVRTRSLAEIWNGPRATALRAAVATGDLTLGCGICRHRLEHDEAERPWEIYDGFEDRGDGPQWPSRLSFQLHNTCNLECVMCGADRSSRIRSRRLGLAPLPRAYGARFFEQLEPFLAHATDVDFNGGEPFLIREHQVVWDMLATANPGVRCSVTTNGTVWNDRVEAVLDRFPTDVLVSVDGVTAPTFEAVRVGASHAAVLENLERFRRYAASRGTWLGVSWCLIRQNWFEFTEFLHWADDLGITVVVQTVIDPEFGLQRADDATLAEVLSSWHDERTHGPELSLERNREVFERQLAMIEAEVRRRNDEVATELYMEPPSDDSVRAVVADILGSSDRPAGPTTVAAAEAHLDRFWSAACSSMTRGWIDLDRAGRVLAADVRAASAALAARRSDPTEPPNPPADLQGVLDGFCHRAGGHLWVVDILRADGFVVHTLAIGASQRDKDAIVLRMASYPTEAGFRLLVHTDDVLSAPSTPVRLGVRRAAVG